MADRKCNNCGTKKNLQGHHRNYQNLGNESDDDLGVLCKECHPAADAARKKRNEKVYEWKRLDGWAMKVYGKHWPETHSLGFVMTKYASWLKNKVA